MEYLKWASENPLLTFMVTAALAWGLRGLGRIGSTRVVAKVKLPKPD